MTTRNDDMARLREKRGLSKADYQLELSAINTRHGSASLPVPYANSTVPHSSHVPAPTSMRKKTNASHGSRGPRLANGLTRRQELFALHYSEHGNPHAAAVAAGYGKAAAVRASENLRHPAILDRIRELVQLRQSAGAPVAVGYIEQIAAGDFADPRRAAVQLKAATVMSHTAGVGPIQRTQVETHAVIEHDVSAAWAAIEEIVGYPLRRPTIDITPTKEIS